MLKSLVQALSPRRKNFFEFALQNTICSISRRFYGLTFINQYGIMTVKKHQTI